MQVAWLSVCIVQLRCPSGLLRSWQSSKATPSNESTTFSRVMEQRYAFVCRAASVPCCECRQYKYSSLNGLRILCGIDQQELSPIWALRFLEQFLSSVICSHQRGPMSKWPKWTTNWGLPPVEDIPKLWALIGIFIRSLVEFARGPKSYSQITNARHIRVVVDRCGSVMPCGGWSYRSALFEVIPETMTLCCALRCDRQNSEQCW